MRFSLFILLLALLSGCGTESRFASSFGKRKYTKGFYCDNSTAIKSAGVYSSQSTKSIPGVNSAGFVHSISTQKTASNQELKCSKKAFPTEYFPAKTLRHKAPSETESAKQPGLMPATKEDEPTQSTKAPDGRIPYVAFLTSIGLNLIIIVTYISLPTLAFILAVISVCLSVIAIALSIYVLITKGSIHKGYAAAILIIYALVLLYYLLFKPALLP